MPPGDIHALFYKASTIIAVPAAAYLTWVNPVVGISSLVGFAAHRYMDNDWDIAGFSKSEGRMINELKLLGYFIYAISSFYGAIFRRHHRSFITHFPGISTIIRIFFVFGWWLIPLYYFGYIQYATWQAEIFLGFWMGLSLADGVHCLCDFLWSDAGHKKISISTIRIKQ